MAAYKNRNSLGMSLIEAIIAMWIVGIVAFSAVICTSSIDNKSNQKRIMALIIAKKELEESKKAIMLGTLQFKNNTYMDTKVIVSSDRVITAAEVQDNYAHNFEMSQDSTDFTNLFLQGKTKLGFSEGEVVLSIYPDTADGSVDIERANGLYVALQKAEIVMPSDDARGKKIATEDEKYNVGGIDSEKSQVLSDDRYIFIVDTNIQYEPVSNPNTSGAGSSDRYRYSFRIAVGWFERIKGLTPFRKEVVYAEVYTKVKNYGP